MRAAAAGLALAAGAAVAGPPEPDCLMPPVERRAAAQTAFQRELADLIAERLPEHAALARLSAELQTALVAARVHRIGWLARTGSDALVVPEDLRGFAWTGAQETALAAAEPDYAALSERIAHLGALNNAHPGWPSLRAAYRAEVAPTGAHGALVAALRAEEETLAPAIAACFGD